MVIWDILRPIFSVLGLFYFISLTIPNAMLKCLSGMCPSRRRIPPFNEWSIFRSPDPISFLAFRMAIFIAEICAEFYSNLYFFDVKMYYRNYTRIQNKQFGHLQAAQMRK